MAASNIETTSLYYTADIISAAIPKCPLFRSFTVFKSVVINNTWSHPACLTRTIYHVHGKFRYTESLSMHVIGEKFATSCRTTHAIGEILSQYKVRAIGEVFHMRKFLCIRLCEESQVFDTFCFMYIWTPCAENIVILVANLKSYHYICWNISHSYSTYRRRGFLSACTYCENSKKLCA